MSKLDVRQFELFFKDLENDKQTLCVMLVKRYIDAGSVNYDYLYPLLTKTQQKKLLDLKNGKVEIIKLSFSFGDFLQARKNEVLETNTKKYL